MNPSLNPETIFAQAIEIPLAEERAAFLAQACGHDAELHREVEKLVKDHFRAGKFLEEPVAEPTSWPTRPQMPLANPGELPADDPWRTGGPASARGWKGSKIDRCPAH